MGSKSALGEAMPVEEKRKLKKDLKSLRMEDVSSFMEALPPDFLIVLRIEYEKELNYFCHVRRVCTFLSLIILVSYSSGLLRAIIRKLRASQRVRLLTYARFALYGLFQEPTTQSGKTTCIMQ